MFSSKTNNNNNDNQEKISLSFNNENNDENTIQNSYIDLNNTVDVTPKINKENKPNIKALKRIENIIASNKNNSNNNCSFKTDIKSIKFGKNINKTYNKPEINNIFGYSNEEKYSLLKIKKIKSKKFSPYKSTNQLFNKVENIYDDQKNEIDSKNLYFKMNKNKRIYSLRKAYISIISYKDENNNNKDFKLFRDDDIGLSNSHKIKILLEDDDVNSDDEIINYGVNKCIRHLETAIELMKKQNKEYVSKYIKNIQNNSLK